MKPVIMRGILILVIISIFISLPSISITAQLDSYLTIQKTVTGNSTDPNQPVTNLLDNDAGTYWGILSGPVEAWAEFYLTKPALIYSLELNGMTGNSTELIIEYQSDGQWQPFLCGNIPNIPANGVIDLSFDRVVTDAVRLHLLGGDISQSRLAEVKICGSDPAELLHRIQPQKVTASENTAPTSSAEFLTDGNTYTRWQTKPYWYPSRYDADLDDLFNSTYPPDDMERHFKGHRCYYNKNWHNQGEVLFELDQNYTIRNLNIYFSQDVKSELSVQIPKGDSWQQVGNIRAGQPVGWYRLDLSRQTITTRQILLTVTGSGEVVGGIGEVEIWGYGAYEGDWHLPLLRRSGELNQPLNYQFALDQTRLLNEYLEITLAGTTTEPLLIDLNEAQLTLNPIVTTDGFTIYSAPIAIGILQEGDNFIRIRPQTNPRTLLTAFITRKNMDGEIAANCAGMTDNLLQTPAGRETEIAIPLSQKCLIEAATVFTKGNIPLQLHAQLGNDSKELTQSGAVTGGTQFNGPAYADNLRLENPSGTEINEVKILGSQTTDRAPTIRILWPTDGEVLDYYHKDHRNLIGFIDNPEAVVEVNGLPVYQNGHYFSIDLNKLPVKLWQTTQVTATAKDPQGRESNQQLEFVYGQLPVMDLDQDDQIGYTDQNTTIISGTVWVSCNQVMINDKVIPVTNHKFQTTVSLVEGLNIIKVNCSFNLPLTNKQFSQTMKRKVVRWSQPISLMIDSPLPDAYINTGTVSITGTVTGLGAIKVTVNGSPAVVDGMYFRVASVPLTVEGKNTLTVKATDVKGRSITKQINVNRDTKAPVLSQITPGNGYLTKDNTINVSGKVTDVNTCWVYINGKTATIKNGIFSGDVTFSNEGDQRIVIQAFDIAGNTTDETVKITTDFTPPKAFTPVANPDDWTNNNRPVITFYTSDQITGIDHYELAIDDGKFVKAASPYRLPPLSDGEHVIKVKAIDKVGWETLGTTKVYIDTTPPVITEFKSIPGTKKIIISWQTKDTDVKSYVLKRSPAFKHGSKKVFGPDIHEYVDTEVEKSKTYRYSLIAIDHIDNASQAIEAPVVQPGIAEAVAVPTQETKIEYENIVVGIPTGALAQTKTLTVMEVDQKEAQPLLDKSMALNVSPVYTFNAETAQGKPDPAGVQFQKPVLVGVHFELTDAYSILKKSNLRAYYYNYKDNNWEVIPESYVDGEKDIVYFFTKHFSMFSVQASLAAPTSPEQIGNMGISPGKSYFQNNEVSISYGGGTTAVTAKDFVLPGRGGLDLTISRTYDSSTAQSDWGIDEKNVFQAACGFVDFGNAFFSFIANMIASQIDHYLSQPSGSCGFGRGWRMNFVWVEKNENGQFVHLPGGSMKKINWVMDGTGWGQQSHGRFECHAGEHFVLEQFQEYVNDIYSESTGGSTTRTKIGENWRTKSFTLVTKDGTTYYLDGDGKITKIVNRLKTSEINFYYVGKKLDYIIDSVGRRIQFNYNGDFVSSIAGAGKTVNYYYDNDLQELNRVVDGGIQETKYHYVHESLRMGSQTVSLVSIVTNLLSGPAGWVNLFLSLLPAERTDDVYYLDKVTTPFNGEYAITYTKCSAIHYSEIFAGFSIVGYEFDKATGFQEIGSAYNKNIKIEYNLNYRNDEPPLIFTCDVIEGKSIFYPDGKKRTHMLFDRYSNSVDKDTSMLKMQTINGENGQLISTNLVDEFDREMEAPLKVIDEKKGSRTVQEFKYDNWGNVVYQKNSHTKVEGYYTYANTVPPVGFTPPVSNSPYGDQRNTINGAIHDARLSEIILNYNGNDCIPQKTFYKYQASGNLLEKAVSSQTYGFLKTGYQYDNYGNIISMTSPSGIRTDYEYSSTYQQALLTKVTLGQLKDANGNVQSNVVLKELGYEPDTYRKRWEKDARKYVTEYQYDAIGREIKTVLPDDDDDVNYYPTILTGGIDQSGARSNNPAQQIAYDDPQKTTTVIDPMGNRTDYIYDSFEHLVEIAKYQKGLLAIPYVYSRVQVSYDDQGNISSIVSPEGSYQPGAVEKYTTSYQYDAVNRLIKINYPKTNDSEPLNPCKVYYYNDESNEVTITDENENETIVKKDPVGRVIEQLAGSRSEERVRTNYTYDSLGNKTSETIDGTIRTTFVYDDLNRLIQKMMPQEQVLNDPAGQPVMKSPVYRYEYDQEGNLIREISPLGTIITHIYDEMSREIRTETKFTGMNGVKKPVVAKTFYDLAGNKLKVVDPNGKTSEFTYTARGWLATQKDPLNGISSFKYDKVGNKISETDPRGNAPGVAANSYTAWYYYDDLYRLVKGVLPDDTPPADPVNPGNNPVVSYEYDRNGNCVKETKANGQEIEYTYSGRNWLLSQTQKLSAKTYTARYEYYPNGNKKYAFDNKDHKTEYLYDHLNRLALETYPEGNTVQYEYDNRGNKHIVHDGNLNQTIYNYDNLNRLHEVIDANNKTTTNWYNEEGRLTKTVSPTGLVTKIYSNELGLPQEIVDSLGQHRYFDYDAAGNTIYKKDPRGTEARFTYDDLYRVLRTDFQNNVEKRQQFMSYDYDPVGNIKQVSNGQVQLIYNNGSTQYESDPFNRIRKVEQVMPDGNRYTTEYQYDIMGQMTGIRYPNSQSWLNYEYDRMGRLIAIPGFAGTRDNPGFDYDMNSALKMIKTDNGITTSIPDIYGRDRNGRLKVMSVTKANGTGLMSISYDYDKANNITRRNDNIYTYTKLNQLETAKIYGAFEDKFTKADLRIGAVNQDYDGSKNPEEDVTEQTLIKMDHSARSLIFNLETDAENVSRIELVPELSGHRVPLEQLEVFYKRTENDFAYTKLERNQWLGSKDEKGRITIKFNPVLKAHLLKIHCNYDDLNLRQESLDTFAEFYNAPEKLVTVYQMRINRTESYQYDAMGNRTTEKILLRKEYGWSYDYYPNSNRLKVKSKDDRSEKWEYAYDPNGNLISKVVTKGNTVDTWEYSYDLLNQLDQVKKNGQVVSSYIYDPNGFRVEKQGTKGKIHYVPLLNGEVGYHKEIENNKEYSFIYVGGQKLARVNGVVGGSSKKFFYHNDHQGSALMITDENGNKVVDRDFGPFGQRINTDIYDEGTKDPDETDDGFTGKDLDEDIGLYYYNARWYDAEIGRFISEDSVADDPNLYGYCGNNPVNMVDPTGYAGVASGGAAVKPSSNPVKFNVSSGMINFACMNSPVLAQLMQGAEAASVMTEYFAGDKNSAGKQAATAPSSATPPNTNSVPDATPSSTQTATNSSEARQATSKNAALTNLQYDIVTGKIDLTQKDLNIDQLMKDYGVPAEQVLDVIKYAAHYIVSNITPNDKGLIEMPFNEVLGLHYRKQVGTLCSWGTPQFVEKIMVIGLYWNYLHPDMYIAFNDLSKSDLSPVTYPNGTVAHSSHMKGIQVDFNIFYEGTDHSITDVKRAKKDTTNSVYLKGDSDYYSHDQAILRSFFTMVNTVYPATFTDILWCDPSLLNKANAAKIRGNQYLRWAHANHIHMGF